MINLGRRRLQRHAQTENLATHHKWGSFVSPCPDPIRCRRRSGARARAPAAGRAYRAKAGWASKGLRQHRHQLVERREVVAVDGGADHGLHAVVPRDVRRVRRQHGARRVAASVGSCASRRRQRAAQASNADGSANRPRTPARRSSPAAASLEPPERQREVGLFARIASSSSRASSASPSRSVTRPSLRAQPALVGLLELGCVGVERLLRASRRRRPRRRRAAAAGISARRARFHWPIARLAAVGVAPVLVDRAEDRVPDRRRPGRRRGRSRSSPRRSPCCRCSSRRG